MPPVLPLSIPAAALISALLNPGSRRSCDVEILAQLASAGRGTVPCLPQRVPEQSPAAKSWNALCEEVRRIRLLENLAERVDHALGIDGASRWDAALDALADGLAVSDERGRLLSANRAFVVLIQQPDEADAAPLIGQNVMSLIPWPQTDEAAQVAARFSEQHGCVQGEVELLTGQWLRVTRRPILDGRHGLVWTVRDFSQQKLAEVARDQFVATATHELRTPLTSLVAYAEALVDAPDIAPADQRRFLNIIRSEALRLSRFVDDLLNVSRMEAGAMVLDRRPADLYRMVDESIESVSGKAQAKQQSLQKQMPLKLPELIIDREKITAALVNLLGNAVKYTPAGGHISLAVQEDSQYIHFRIQDSGFGIAAEELPHVFDKFFRSDDDRVRLESGTGLGLSFTREIARLHGGNVSAESELNVGSCFTLSLPLAENSDDRGV